MSENNSGAIFAAAEFCRTYDGPMSDGIANFVTCAMSGIKKAFISGWDACARQNKGSAEQQPITQVKTSAAPTPEWEILRALYYACCEADAHGELSEYIDGSLLDRAKLLLT